jgi:hypothetical protein
MPVEDDGAFFVAYDLVAVQAVAEFVEIIFALGAHPSTPSLQIETGAQWNRGPVAGSAAEPCRGRLSSPRSRNPGARRQRCDGGKPLHHGVEKEAHPERKSRV